MKLNAEKQRWQAEAFGSNAETTDQTAGAGDNASKRGAEGFPSASTELPAAGSSSPVIECFRSSQECGTYLQGCDGSLQQYLVQNDYSCCSSSGDIARAPLDPEIQRDIGLASEGCCPSWTISGGSTAAGAQAGITDLKCSQACPEKALPCLKTAQDCLNSSQQYSFQNVSDDFRGLSDKALRALPEHEVESANGPKPDLNGGRERLHGNPPDRSGEAASVPVDVSPATVHSCSRPVAVEVGLAAAAIAQHLAFCAAVRPRYHDHVPYYRISSATLAKRLPYLGKKTIDRAVHALEAAGYVRLENHNGRRRDRTRWFLIAPDKRDELRRPAEKIFFRQDDAENYGLLDAALLYHIERREWDGDHAAPAFSPTWVADYLGCGRATVYRMLERLEGERVLKWAANPDGTSTWRIAEGAPRRRLEPAATATVTASSPSSGAVIGSDASVTGAPQRLPERQPRQDHPIYDSFAALNRKFFKEYLTDDFDKVTAAVREVSKKLSDEDRLLLYQHQRDADTLLEIVNRWTGQGKIQAGPEIVLIQQALVVAYADPPLPSPFPALRDGWYQIGLEERKTCMAILRQREEAQYDEARSSSPRFEQEADATLNPQEKVEVLQQGIAARNRAPRRNVLGERRVLKAGLRDFTAARAFFEAHTAIAPRDLVILMERSLTCADPIGEFDPQWHLRRASDLAFLLQQFEKVVQECGVHDEQAGQITRRWTH